MAYREFYSVEQILNTSLYSLCYDSLKEFFPKTEKYYIEQCACSYSLKVINSKMEPASREELKKYAKEYFKNKNIKH